MAKLGRQGKRRLNAKRPQQSRDDAGEAPLRHGDAVGHKGADQQHGQIEQGQLGRACDGKRDRHAKLAKDPAAPNA